jgi:YVTN family beta-propeller protein
LEVTAEDGRPVVVTRGHESALLALLLLQRGAPISVDRIIEELWANAAPENARKSIHIYVSRLRKVIGSSEIETSAAGYRLAVPPEALDLTSFEGLVEDGRSALNGGDPALALQTFDKALGFWRGEALADFRYEAFAQHEIRRLDELRAAALADRIDGQLALNREDDAIPGIRRLIADHPLWERPRRQLMLALYRGGRQAEALGAFRELRVKLDEELALEPSAELQELERQILNHDPQLGRVHRPPHERRRGRAVLLIGAGGALLLAATIVAVVVVVAGGGSRGSLSTIAPNSLGAIDPKSNRLVAQLPLGSSPTAVSVDSEGSVWVADGGRRQLTAVDPQRLKVVKRVSLESIPTATAVGGNFVWATDPLGAHSGALSRVDARSGAIRQIAVHTGFVADLFAPATPNAVAPDGGAGVVWTNTIHNQLVRYDRLLERFSIGRGHSIDGIAVGAGSIWIASSVDDSVLRFDPQLGRTVAVIPVAAVRGRRAAGPAAIAFGFGSIWVADALDDRVTRIDPHTQAVTATMAVASRPTELAIGAGGVWALNSGSGSVSHIDPSTNSVVATIEVGRVLTGLAASRSRVWVAVAGGTPPPTTPPPTPAQPVRTGSCSRIDSGGGAPDLLVVSDLPLLDNGGTANPQIFDVEAAIRAVLRAHAYRAGSFRIGYQSCSDSQPTESPDPPLCAANARAYAADASVVGVIGAFQSICTGIELPILDTAKAGPIAVASPSNTYVGLTHTGPQTGPDEPDRYFPTGVRNFVRLVGSDDAQGAALAQLARQLGRKRIFVLDDGDPTSAAMASYVEDAAGALGLHVAGLAEWSPTGRYRALAARIQRARADAVVITGCICTNGGQLVIDLRRGLGPSMPFLASDNFTCSCDMAAPGAPHEGYGMYITGAGAAPARLSASARRFLHVVFPGRPLADIDANVPTAAAAAEALLQAIAASNGARADIVAQLTHNRVSTTTLGAVAFDANGDPVRAPFTIYRVTPNAPAMPHQPVGGRAVDRVIEADLTLSR